MFVVFFSYVLLFLQACHDHNIIAPCGMIKVFLIELNYTISTGKMPLFCTPDSKGQIKK